ncbi:hypothetical protein ACFQZM_09485 [Actinomadura fibrosa]|uniref:Guanylate cyclase domain-containing protein n=2 Tax=Actinomadura fibrosa TaxID=111802 RepID=A0ABW2XJ74_9ACTN|nr:hypothetical protein [Actinomadura fibrosa]
MNDRPVAEYRVLLTVDIEDYSSRSDAEQRALQSVLSESVDRAADAARLRRQEWLRQMGGDGFYAVLPPNTDVTRLMDTFVRELDAELGMHNRRRAGDHWSRLRLRLAVHAGPIHIDGATGWPGHHVVQPARLRDSDPVRAAMHAVPAADIAVIVSSEVYRDYIVQGPGEPRPSDFRQVHVAVKKQAYEAYLYLPGHDIHEVASLAGHQAGAQAPPADPGAQDTSGGTDLRVAPETEAGHRPSPSAGRDFIGHQTTKVTDSGTMNIAHGDMSFGSERPSGRQR